MLRIKLLNFLQKENEVRLNGPTNDLTIDGRLGKKPEAGAPQEVLHEVAAELTEQILGSYQTCINEREAEWMKSLTSSSVQYLAEKRGVRYSEMRMESLYNHAAHALVARIFNLLKVYANDYNGQVGWNELFITATKPSMCTEVLKYNMFREPIETITNLRARFSTKHWSLAIRARKNKIEFFLIPAYKSIGLTKAEAIFEPIFTISGRLEGNEINWYIADHPLFEESFEDVCQHIFASLVHQSRNDMSQANSMNQQTTDAEYDAPVSDNACAA